MNYIEQLKFSYQKFSSLICLGLDPILEDIPEQGDCGKKIYTFYYNILNKIIQKKVYPSAVKPNYAFYAQYGFDGLHALIRVIELFKAEGFPVILDVKRGDIGKTAQAYAKEAFDFFKADAVTISPYLGFDSISPFVEDFPDKGCYILTKTSNKSSSEIQDILYRDKPLFLYLAEKITDWYKPGMGSVIGATYPEQLLQIAEIFIKFNKCIPLLIPGIGTQGGSLKEVMTVLKLYKDIWPHRINSSSGINYAYKIYPGKSYDEAAVMALKELNDEVTLLLSCK